MNRKIYRAICIGLCAISAWGHYAQAESLAQIKPQLKPVTILLFSSPICQPCKTLESTLHTQPIVTLLNDSYSLYTINLQSQERIMLPFFSTPLSSKDLRKQFAIATTPTLVFLHSDIAAQLASNSSTSSALDQAVLFTHQGLLQERELEELLRIISTLPANLQTKESTARYIREQLLHYTLQ